MARVLIHVEGQTEETFVNNVLAPHLYGFGYTSVSAKLVGNARQRSRRGGIHGWSTVRMDIRNHLREDRQCLATTMVDYYALPASGERAWPGRAEATMLPFASKAPTIHRALSEDIAFLMGTGFDIRRFIPYVMMHEFEGLLFSDCSRFANSIGRPDLESAFQDIRDGFGTPEEINDSPLTAPSKRVESLVGDYQKPLFGTLASLEIGLEAIRRECPQFRDWIAKLESWPQG